ncbi:MAG: HIT family protein [Deltaproteobacteria bacterium]
MKNGILWAPWRLPYLKSAAKKERGCLFCRAARLRRDRDGYVFLRSRHAVGLLNLYPYTNGHVMIAPRRHAGKLDALKNDELCDIMEQVREAVRRVEKALRPDGFNIGINIGRAGGAGIAGHLHVHIVPRWAGDTNFMRTCAGTKVISQSLNDLYGVLIRGNDKR